MTKGGLLEEVRSFVMNMGYRLLDLRETQQKADRIIRFAIYRPEGVGVGDCARVTLAVRDFIFSLNSEEDIRVEVSSPGAERVFKGSDDYELFVMRKVQLTLKTGKVYQPIYKGLDETSGNPVFVLREAGLERELMVPFSDIGKCRLVLE